MKKQILFTLLLFVSVVGFSQTVEEIPAFMQQETPEEINDTIRSINAAFDSVGLIYKKVEVADTTKEELKVVYLNIEHLKIMSKQEWFFNALSEDQKDSISESIVIGETFIYSN